MPKQKCEKQKYPNQNMWERSESSKKRASPVESYDFWLLTQWTELKLSQFDFDNRQGWVEFVNSASGGNYTFSIAGPRRWVFEAVASNLKPPLEVT